MPLDDLNLPADPRSSLADIVIAAEGIKVGFPEVKRGVVAGVGGIPNAFHRSPQLVPYLLTGNPIPTNLLEHVVFTEVVPVDKVQDAALRWALDVVDNSPEAVWVTKEQVNLTRDGNSLQEVVIKSLETEQSERLYVGENLKEGLKAFVEVRLPLASSPAASQSAKRTSLTLSLAPPTISPSLEQKRKPVWQDPPALSRPSKL